VPAAAAGRLSLHPSGDPGVDLAGGKATPVPDDLACILLGLQKPRYDERLEAP
jgi:hypothetical protein